MFAKDNRENGENVHFAYWFNEIFERKIKVKKCEWNHDEDNIFYTSCKNSFQLSNDATPKENEMKYCCYCGEEIEGGIKRIPWVASAFVYGDNKAYNVCLVVPEYTLLNKIAKEMYKFAMMDRIEQEPWSKASTETKMYYRRIALWHIDKLALIESAVDRAKDYIIDQLEKLTGNK